MHAELYLQARLNLDELVAQEIPLEGINDAYRLQETGADGAASSHPSEVTRERP